MTNKECIEGLRQINEICRKRTDEYGAIESCTFCPYHIVDKNCLIICGIYEFSGSDPYEWDLNVLEEMIYGAEVS